MGSLYFRLPMRVPYVVQFTLKKVKMFYIYINNTHSATCFQMGGRSTKVVQLKDVIKGKECFQQCTDRYENKRK